MAELKAQAVEPTDWYFILGWDNLSKIPQWREPAKLIEMCFLAAVPRPGYERPNMKKLEAALPGISKKVILMDKPRLESAHGYQKQGCSGYTDRRPGPSSGGKIYPGKRVIPETVGLKTERRLSLCRSRESGNPTNPIRSKSKSVTANR